MARLRPYASLNKLIEEADRIWGETAVEDWLEAFAAHPRIGEGSKSRWSEEEQARARSAETNVLEELAATNRAYYERFGFIFIICASGKGAGEMLEALRKRFQNDRETELRNAAEQQRQITRLRLVKLLTP
jgi:OHCU decarboxylase